MRGITDEGLRVGSPGSPGLMTGSYFGTHPGIELETPARSPACAGFRFERGLIMANHECVVCECSDNRALHQDILKDRAFAVAALTAIRICDEYTPARVIKCLCPLHMDMLRFMIRETADA